MNALDETEVREQLKQALDVLDPTPPPYGAIAARATKRRRRLRISAGLGGVALAGACALVGVAIVGLGSGGNATITASAGPSGQSLQDFATAHGALSGGRFGRQIGGPYETSGGFYGAFTVKHGAQIARWDGSAWQLDGATITKQGPGQFIERFGDGPALGTSLTPTIYERGMGGDVSYFGTILARTPDGWKGAKFGACGHHKLCYPSDAEPYGHLVGNDVRSVNNDCTPDCASGTEYRITWRWDMTTGRYDAVHVRKP